MAVLRHSAAFPFLLLLVLLICIPALASGVGLNDGGGGLEEEGEQFSEELFLKPLPDRKVLAHFHFQSTAPPSAANGRHHHLFPKAIAQLVRKFRIKDLELSFTQGRWNYESWGGSDPISSTNAKPPGVELWALFDLPVMEIDATWKDLTHALSGLFCASINFLESSTSYFAPSWAFRSNVSNLRYGALPREAVCTENLTPWLKLLPCRDKAGLASLLDRPSIYKGYYHSQRLQLTSTKSTGMVLKQTLTVVLKPDVQRNSAHSSLDNSIQPSWSVSSMFKKNVTGLCVPAKTSRIFFELETNMVVELEKLGYGDSWSNSIFDLSPNPVRVFKESNPLPGRSNSIIYEYINYSEHEPLDLGMKWKLPFIWSCSQSPFHASRFLMGSGNERGSIAISLQSTESNKEFLAKSHGCTVQVLIFQVVPWYVKVYYHTLQVFIDGKPQSASDVIEKIQVSPSEDKLFPGTLELMLRYPCSVQSVALTLDFDKGFLHIDEYPPDANQGFDIPSALVTFPNFHSSRSYVEDNLSINSPLLLKFQEKNVVRSYTEALLVPLTTPDFSMPYNVITFTCTVLALYFGSLLNVLRRRVGEEERLLNSKGNTTRIRLIPLLLSKFSSKLKGRTDGTPKSSSLLGSKFLFILVVVLAVLWHYIAN
ncbi:Gpi16 subunit, GPI transamidase component [Musa troglodytarum]|uniref:Gpi16 subunit, GPI transamidase component n=2 Tax=Musa troglodytarum TaxID=320322 RepID=A0A9E7K8G5_9LILI|nr:Gpi16 subunit, GPI transamidase component [Musa troglodytarum]